MEALDLEFTLNTEQKDPLVGVPASRVWYIMNLKINFYFADIFDIFYKLRRMRQHHSTTRERKSVQWLACPCS